MSYEMVAKVDVEAKLGGESRNIEEGAKPESVAVKSNVLFTAKGMISVFSVLIVLGVIGALLGTNTIPITSSGNGGGKHVVHMSTIFVGHSAYDSGNGRRLDDSSLTPGFATTSDIQNYTLFLRSAALWGGIGIYPGGGWFSEGIQSVYNLKCC